LATPLFELIKRDVAFVWNLDCQQAFEALKKALIVTPVLVCLDFKKPFYLDIDWSPKGVGAPFKWLVIRFQNKMIPM